MTSADGPPIEPGLLTAHVAGARRLALALLGDPDAADDVAQDALLVALTKPPRSGWNLRAWLSGVVRNKAREQRRAMARRPAALDASDYAARPEVPDLDERMETQRRLFAAVLALPEIYRTVVWLRHFEALPPRKIAERLGAPPETVRTRHRRALDLLRDALGGAPGSQGKRWQLALLPLAMPDGAHAAAAVSHGGLLVTAGTKSALVVGGVVLLAVAALLWTGRSHDELERAAASPGLGPTAVGDASERAGPVLLNGRRIARAGKGGLVGRVLEVRTALGVPKAAVTLTGRGLADEAVETRTETAADGSFRLSDVAAGLDFTLRIEVPGLVSLHQQGVVVRADGVGDLGDLWLGLPGALEGFVQGPAGEGVAGVEVELHRGVGSLREFLQSGGFLDLYATMDREPEPLARTTTGSKGVFRFEGASTGPAALVVRAPGYRQTIVSLTLTAETAHAPVTVRLAHGATLAGKVVDESGQGLPGVRLAAFREDGGRPSPLSRTFTDSASDGTFRFASLAGEGKHVVVGTAPGHPNAFTQARAGDTDVRVVMRRGATLEVRVVSDAGDTPVHGAQVLVAVGTKRTMDAGPGSLVGGLTDASGTTALDVFPGELQLVIVNAPGFPPNYWDGAGRSAATSQGLKGPTDPRVPEGRSTLTFRLPTGIKLTGKVLDSEGGPLAGVEVTSLGFLGSGDKTKSRSDGTYELHVVTAEFSMGVMARLPGWVQDRSDSPYVDHGDARARAATERTMDIGMRRAITVAGRVLDPEGRPVAGATVTVRTEEKRDGFVFDPTTQRLGRLLGGHPSSITLANGTYTVDGVPSEGLVRVLARHEGFVDGWTGAFEVGKGLTQAPDVRLLAGADLGVRVLGPDGRGVGGARVRVEVERADQVQADDWESMLEHESGQDDRRTGATGAVELALLPPGKVTLRVAAKGFAPTGARVNIASDGGPQEPVTVRLRPGATVSGRVLDRDGHPLEGALVVVAAGPVEEENWLPDWDISRRATTDALGQWSVKDLPDKQFVVQASKDGYVGAVMPVGEAGTPVELRLVKLDPQAAKRIAEINKAEQALYGRMSVEGEAPAILEELHRLREERQRLYDGGK